MYKIRVFFKSNEKGIHTEEIETASTEQHKNYRYKRAIGRWLDILCCKCNVNFINFDSQYTTSPSFAKSSEIRECVEQMENDISLYIIQQQILFMNKFKKDGDDDAKFEIEVMEVKRCTCH